MEKTNTAQNQQVFGQELMTIERTFNMFLMDWHDKWNDVSTNKCTN